MINSIIEFSGHKVLTIPQHNGKMDPTELDEFLKWLAEREAELELPPGASREWLVVADVQRTQRDVRFAPFAARPTHVEALPARRGRAGEVSVRPRRFGVHPRPFEPSGLL